MRFLDKQVPIFGTGLDRILELDGSDVKPLVREVAPRFFGE
jgi:hypothetical protein